MAIEYALRVLGKEELTLKHAQRHAIYQIVSERKDVLAVLPTGFGKSLVYQILAPIFDYLNCGLEPVDKQKCSLIIVVSPLNALIQDQIAKLSDKISVCVAKAERVISVGHTNCRQQPTKTDENRQKPTRTQDNNDNKQKNTGKKQTRRNKY